tara:strand:+ start:576 stop:788 length:213 start_codon:yes stop_codon:yes gene_type:complete
MKKILMVDPDEGWKYGFPKALPNNLRNKDITEWLIQSGYPRERVEMWESKLGHIPCRMWETEVINIPNEE